MWPCRPRQALSRPSGAEPTARQVPNQMRNRCPKRHMASWAPSQRNLQCALFFCPLIFVAPPFQPHQVILPKQGNFLCAEEGFGLPEQHFSQPCSRLKFESLVSSSKVSPSPIPRFPRSFRRGRYEKATPEGEVWPLPSSLWLILVRVTSCLCLMPRACWVPFHDLTSPCGVPQHVTTKLSV